MGVPYLVAFQLLWTPLHCLHVYGKGRINEPTLCGKQKCLAKNSMTLVHNRCRFADKQIVRLQGTPDEIPDGGTLHIVSLLTHDKLVDAGKPSDKVEVIGIHRAMRVRVGPTQRINEIFIQDLHRLSSFKKD